MLQSQVFVVVEKSLMALEVLENVPDSIGGQGQAPDGSGGPRKNPDGMGGP